jgi:Zn-dependent protease
MALLQNGSLRLFRVAGVDVMIGWSWLILAGLEVQFRRQKFQSPLWNVAEFLSYFAIVSLPQVGRVIACRQVGGTADRIILQPFGGIAVVHPPPRPWPVFWTAAGSPLVSLLLVPVLFFVLFLCHAQGWPQQSPDLQLYLWVINILNIVFLVFGLLPLYPYAGGQMIYAILWAIIGRWPALIVVSTFSVFAGVSIFLLLFLAGFRDHELWFLAFFASMMTLSSIAAFAQARRMMQVMNQPRHQDASCPKCGAHPIQGQHWVCDSCRMRFDTFETLAECPKCLKRFPETACLECGGKHSIIDWFPRRESPLPAEAAPQTAAPPLLGPYRSTDEWDKDVPRDYS